MSGKAQKHYVLREGIKCFNTETLLEHEDYHAAGLDVMQNFEQQHFWFVSRKEFITSMFNKYLSKTKKIIEIGAGTGFVAKGLQEAGYNISVGEMHLSGLRYAKEKGLDSCYQFDLFDPPFEEEFDSVGLFDVLEHLDDDVRALAQISKMVKPEGLIFITVPAHQWLWNRDDKIASHKRRYSKKTLTDAVKQSGLEVIRAKYFFIFILPLLYIRRLLNKDHDGVVTAQERNAELELSRFNKLLLIVTRFENYFFKWLPDIPGGSIFLVAKK